MIRKIIVPTLFISLFLVSSCAKEEEALSIYSNNIVPSDQVTATSFTVSISGTFSGIDKMDLALGKRGLIYCVKSDNVEDMFKDWLDGKDCPEVKMLERLNSTGESMQCMLYGLAEDTEYSYSLYFQKRDGTREISRISSFQTKPFNPEIDEVALDGVECFVAFVSGTIKMDSNDADCCETGIVISEQQKGSVDNSMVFSINGSGIRTRINGLEPDKDYYCRLYVKYPSFAGQPAYKYGSETSFRTKNFNDVAVDLGLPSGTLWAAYNVGAEKPEDYGDYFAWAEIEPKKNYNWSTYKWRNNDKYNTDTTSTKVSSHQYIELADDAANYSWGGDWRMPSHIEQDELAEFCDFYLDTLNGVIGRLIVSQINGNAIFTPFAGIMNEEAVLGAGQMWVTFARDLYFADGPYWFWYWRNNEEDITNEDFERKYMIGGRSDGLTVRAVYPR